MADNSVQSYYAMLYFHFHFYRRISIKYAFYFDFHYFDGWSFVPNFLAKMSHNAIFKRLVSHKKKGVLGLINKMARNVIGTPINDMCKMHEC